MKNFSKVRQGDEQGWSEVGFGALQWRIGFPWLEKFRGRKIRWWIFRRFEKRVFLERRSRFSKMLEEKRNEQLWREYYYLWL